jgi:hypothetical protein
VEPERPLRRVRRTLLLTSWERRFIAMAVGWAFMVFAEDALRHGDHLFDGIGEWVIATYAFYTVPFVLAAAAQASATPSLRAGVLASTLLPAATLGLVQDFEFIPVFVFLSAATFAAGRSAGRQFWNLTTPERALVVGGAISVVWLSGLLFLYEGHRGKGEHCWVVSTSAAGEPVRAVFVHGPGTLHTLDLHAPAESVMECLPHPIDLLPLIEAGLLLLGTAVLAIAALRPPQARNQSARL